MRAIGSFRTAFYLLGCLLGASLLLAWAPAAAGEDAAEEERSIEEIVVTATRRATSIQDVPYNISAVDGGLVEDTQILDSAELLRNFAGVGTVDRGYRNSGTFNAIRLRGLNLDHSGQGDYPVIADATVATYVNDTPVFANFLLKDLERVEVLRGPQGTLYGSGALAGAVRYITRRPQLEQFSGSGSLSYSTTHGSDGQNLTLDLALNAPIGETAALRLVGSTFDYDGLVDYVNLYELDADGVPVAPAGLLDPAASYTAQKDADSVDVKFVRTSLLWEPNESLAVVFSAVHQEDKIGGRRQTTPNVDGYGRRYGRFENGSPFREPAWRYMSLASLELQFDFDSVTLHSSTAYYDHRGNAISDNTGFYAKALVWQWIQFLAGGVQVPRPAYSTHRHYADETFTQELRLVSDSGGTFEYVLGLFYKNQDLANLERAHLHGITALMRALPFSLVNPQSDLNFHFSNEEDFSDLAVFGELTWHFSDAVRATFGLRYFDNDSEKGTFMDLLILDAVPAIEQSWKTSDTDVLFKGSLAWDFTANDMLYGTVAEGYRRGGTNAVPLSGIYGEDPAWQEYGSDSVVNYELGVKGARGGFRYGAALYYVDWKDAQLNTATPNGGFYAAQNADAAKTRGVELELVGNWGENLSFSLGYAFVDAQVTADFVAPHNGALIAPDGARLPGSAKHAFNAALNFNAQLTQDIAFFGNLNGYYQSSTLGQINPDLRCFAFSLSGGPEPCYGSEFDGFQIWNAVGTLSFDSWHASLWGKNLFDELGITGTFSEDFSGTSPVVGFFGNSARQMIALPRTFGLTLNYRF